MRKPILNPNYKPNHADDKACMEILHKMDEALETIPFNYDLIQEVLFKLNSPGFEYPHVEKCSAKCTAPERNIAWKKALDLLKTIEGVTDYDDIYEIYDKSRLQLFEGKGYFQ